ncbi:4-hydroxythreonine-4-phosphate dehydrogenase [Rhodonellum psychrophilum GCM71 = DSM 17998]|uniref:4-hydroxythreonine-4-phosphate dehydrogenase n=2 Tax=Rhodonellum TaxID=336827 RepID=U5C3D7_9BACT|nr:MULTISPECIES: 4-hydroxythreonine-4-phosphate dehydrogenase PdxA [Rhodonellum]ERM84578.1 4-hydroxythreonine-4-phosphate dehydrogenase [Rhodonellum psychrophilum GCM71 = DSM 17998]SDY85644.1 4-hydroxythreonine-4-phosphate dehydrogenase [Rhodonellum ikkaensis]
MNPRKNKPIIGISIGDINGISAEVTMKALMDNRIHKIITPVIYAHGKALTFYRKHLGMDDFNFMQIRSINEVHHKKINVINVLEESPEVIPGVETQEAGKLALAALDQAIADLKENKIDALVTAPLNKSNINSEALKFVGHTEYLTEAFGINKSLMFLVAEGIRVGVVTGHIPLKEVPNQVTAANIKGKLEIMIQSLQHDFGIPKPRIAVLGLNPHAGEDGLLGDEEESIIKPVIGGFKEKGHLVFGPYPADGFFGMMHQKKFDGVLAMYHDQGLIPFKSLAFETGVNFTAGLPIIRTSPDHGTAYNIAGKNIANEGSMSAAIFQAYDIIKSRTGWEEEEN